MKRKTRIVTGTAAAALLLAGLVVTFAFPEKALNLALREALRHFPALGLQIDLRRVTLTEIELDVAIPSKGILIRGVKPRVSVRRYFPLAIDIRWDQALDRLAVSGNEARDVAVAVEARYASQGGWGAEANISVRDFAGFSSITVRAGLEGGKVRVQAGAGHPSGPIALVVGGQYREDPARETIEGELTLDANGLGARYEGPIAFRAEEGVGKLHIASVAGKGSLQAYGITIPRPRWALDLTLPGNGAREIALDLTLPFPQGDASIDGKLRLPPATPGARAIAATGAGRASWRARDAGFALPALSLAWDVSGTAPYRIGITLPAESAHVQLPGVSALRFGGTLTGTVEETRKATLTASLRESRGWLTIKGRGTWDPGKKGGALELTLPLVLSPTLQPAQLVPALEDRLTAVSGTIRIVARATLAKGKASPDLRATAEGSGIAATAGGVPLEGIAIALAGEAPAGAVPSGRATASIARVGQKSLFERVRVEAQADSPEEIHVRTAEASLPGGTLSATPFTVRFPSGDFSTTIRVRDADAQKLLATLGYDNLSGKGKFHGKLPLTRREGALYIENGKLENDGPGVVQYKDATISGVAKSIDYLSEFQALMQQGQQALAFKALDNFHYETLVIGVERSARDKLSLALHLNGSNPDIAKGQRFELNMPITGDLESLLMESLLKSMMENEAWEKKVRSAQEKQR